MSLLVFSCSLSRLIFFHSSYICNSTKNHLICKGKKHLFLMPLNARVYRGYLRVVTLTLERYFYFLFKMWVRIISMFRSSGSKSSLVTTTFSKAEMRSVSASWLLNILLVMKPPTRARVAINISFNLSIGSSTLSCSLLLMDFPML